MNTRLVQRPGTVTSTLVPSGIFLGAAIVRPSTGTVPAAVRPISSGQQIAQAQYAVRMLVILAADSPQPKQRHAQSDQHLAVVIDAQLVTIWIVIREQNPVVVGVRLPA